ncbi:hypothetical protein [Paenibacillus lentus]|uniref:Uncharacterized protein n=1 Tax=Paenibacillus lentus TaxID=1338368 RepID=A0A3S8RW52_9BACL|nr:hypothetical protein [Paenibacillus lentus]AZK47311.1 hypothetical protein EIM92_15020 [Paenibacillus lentus]
MKVKLIFTNKGQIAIDNFDNGELIEIFSRYMKTLTKQFDVEASVPIEANQNITDEGAIRVSLTNVNCDVNIFFKELGKDIKVPLRKRLDKDGKLDNVFKIEVIE